MSIKFCHGSDLAQFEFLITPRCLGCCWSRRNAALTTLKLEPEMYLHHLSSNTFHSFLQCSARVCFGKDEWERSPQKARPYRSSLSPQFLWFAPCAVLGLNIAFCDKCPMVAYTLKHFHPLCLPMGWNLRWSITQSSVHCYLNIVDAPYVVNFCECVSSLWIWPCPFLCQLCTRWISRSILPVDGRWLYDTPVNIPRLYPTTWGASRLELSGLHICHLGFFRNFLISVGNFATPG